MHATHLAPSGRVCRCSSVASCSQKVPCSSTTAVHPGSRPVAAIVQPVSQLLHIAALWLEQSVPVCGVPLSHVQVFSSQSVTQSLVGSVDSVQIASSCLAR